MGKNFVSNLLEKDLLCVGRELGLGRTIITHTLNKHLFKKKIDLVNRIIYQWSHYYVQRIMKNLLLLLPRYILFGWVIPNCQTILDVKKRKREVITACDCEYLCVWLFFYLNSHSWSLSHGAENLASEISGQTSPYLVNSHFSIPTTSFEFEMQHGLFPVSPS